MAVTSTPTREFIDARAHAQFGGTLATQDEVTAWYYRQTLDHDGAVKLAAEFMDEMAAPVYGNGAECMHCGRPAVNSEYLVNAQRDGSMAHDACHFIAAFN